MYFNQKIFQLLIGVTLLVMPLTVSAKPVTWPGSIQIMSMNDSDMNALHLIYTITPDFSIQNRTDYMRDDHIFIGGIQGNTLLKRWNFPHAQGNIYAGAGIGTADGDNSSATPALFTNILADYETRRFFISYEMDGIAAGKTVNQLWHRGRVGVAPYLGGYNDLHTWTMIQTDFRPNMDNDITVTPMLRFFTTHVMIETGVSHRGQGMINLIAQF